MQIFYRGLDSRSRTLSVQPDDCILTVKACLEAKSGIPAVQQGLVFAGKQLEDSRLLSDYGVVRDTTLQLVLRLRGGKGGFGALLRGAGRAALTDNFDACRDLSGRRMRHVNAEQKLRDWAKQSKELKAHLAALKRAKEEEKKAKRDASNEEELDKVKAAQRVALSGVMAALQDGLVDSGLVQSSNSGEKRPADEAGPSQPAAKRARFDLDSFELSDSDLSSDDDFDLSSDDEDVAAEPEKAASSGSGSDKSQQDAAERQGSAQAAASTAAMAETVIDGAVEEACKPESERLRLDTPVTLAGQGDAVVLEIDLQPCTSAKDLEGLGLDRLKQELQKRGLKCGGTLSDRAARLFLLKDSTLESLDVKHFAKVSKK